VVDPYDEDTLDILEEIRRRTKVLEQQVRQLIRIAEREGMFDSEEEEGD
jgi:hypothetical protein